MGQFRKMNFDGTEQYIYGLELLKDPRKRAGQADPVHSMVYKYRILFFPRQLQNI